MENYKSGREMPSEFFTKYNINIINFVKKECSLQIGDRTAEEIKIEIGSALPYADEGYYEIRGRDVVTGLPKNIKISAELNYFGYWISKSLSNG